MNLGLTFRPLRNVRLLVTAVAGNAVILDAGINADTVRVNVWLDVVQVEIVADIAVELAVIEVAGIAVNRTPHLPGRVRVTAESGQTGGTVEGSIDAISRSLVRPRDALRFQDREPNPLVFQQSIQAGIVSALREPEAVRLPAKDLPIVLGPHPDLGAHCRFIDG
jgi:hypothetical protein